MILLLVVVGSIKSSNSNADIKNKDKGIFLTEMNTLPKELPLPVFPSSSSSSSKFIPHLIWISIKNASIPLSKDTRDFLHRNSDWEAHACDVSCQDNFIDRTFAGTSTQWAYNLIHPYNRAARTDLWKYAVLYTFGGLYIDDSVDFSVPLNDIVQSTDRFIVSGDVNAIDVGACYKSTFHLSSEFAMARYNSTTNIALFNASKLASWAIFIEPRNSIILRTMDNVIEIVKSEYARKTVIATGDSDVKQKAALCTTTYALTYSVREALLARSVPESAAPRVCNNSFFQYGAKVRVSHSSHHTRKGHQHSHLLKDHTPLTKEKTVDYLEGKVVSGEGKSIFLVRKGVRHAFPDFETFLKMKYQSNQVIKVGGQVLNSVPLGKPLQSLAGADNANTESTELSMVDVAKITSSHEMLTFTQTVINNRSFSCYGDDYSGTRDELLGGMWKKVIGNNPIMVYPLCLRLFQLGNTLGYYFNDVACSSIAGAHFIGVHKEFSLIEPEALNTKPENHFAFFNALPDRIVHKSPNDIVKVKEVLKKECHCLQYCWENNEAPWLKRVDMIRDILVGAVDAYLKVADVNRTITNNKTDLTYIPTSKGEHLPLLPSVVIQYRCGDNIGFGKTRYGLLPFRSFKSRIPPWATSIYVIADSPNRQQGHPYSSRCGTILTSLFSYLTKLHPNAIVVVKRGGDQFLDYARMIYANVTICSASTFCLWPSLANVGGKSYFPLTPLVAKATSNTTAPFLGKHFHWIDDVEMIKEFKGFRPWTQIIDVLLQEEK